jgi:hypothetical protein
VAAKDAGGASLTLGLSGLIWIISQFYPHWIDQLLRPILSSAVEIDSAAYRYFDPIAWQFFFSRIQLPSA